MHGLKPISHYHFREKIALAWLDEAKYWPTRYSRRPRTHTIRTNDTTHKRTKTEAQSSVSSARVTRSITSSTLSTLPSITRSCKTLNMNSLVNGSFDKRLILSDEFTHLPAPAMSKHSECHINR